VASAFRSGRPEAMRESSSDFAHANGNEQTAQPRPESSSIAINSVSSGASESEEGSGVPESDNTGSPAGPTGDQHGARAAE
jgi:hypothetical protein